MADNIGVKGKVVFAGTTTGIQGLEVFAVDFDPINDEQILNSNSKPAITQADGSFDIRYSVDAYRQWYDDGPDLVVRVQVPGGRLVYESDERSNVTAPILDVGMIEIHKNNVEGWLVTCATLDPTNGDAVWLTKGNLIEPLIDGAKVFPKLTERAKTATQSINFMNYKFYVDDEVVTSFKSPSPFVQPINGSKLVGEKLQEVLKSQSKKIPVRVLVWNFNLEPLLALVSAVLFSGLSSLIALIFSISLVPFLLAMFFVGFIGGLTLGVLFGDTARDVKRYFGVSDSKVETRAFLSLWSVMHARVVVIDGTTGFVLGSSIARGYFSDNEHLIHDARHGGGLIHDVNVMITGPAVEHLDRSFATIWNQSGGEPLTPATGQKELMAGQPAPGAPSRILTAPELAPVQVIRTLPADTFKAEHTGFGGVPKQVKGKLGIPAGETAILEAYQRAIAQAKNFIYIEDQYFTCKEIVDALIHRMKAIEDLQLILVINVKPDHYDYRKKQIDRIKQLKKAITKNPDRIQIHTLWSCAAAKPKMDIMPIEIHSKVGIIDDNWATVGTANLDAASMNQIDTVSTEDTDDAVFKQRGTWKRRIMYGFYPILKPLIASALAIGGHYAFRQETQHANPNFSDHPSRFVDLNLMIYSDVEGEPKNDFVEAFRKELWAEHLGLMSSDPKLNNPGKPGSGWAAQLWKDQEEAKFKDTKKQTNHPAKVLAWQPHLGHKEYLAARGLTPAAFCIRKKADVFDLEKSQWEVLKLNEKCEK